MHRVVDINIFVVIYASGSIDKHRMMTMPAVIMVTRSQREPAHQSSMMPSMISTTDGETEVAVMVRIGERYQCWIPSGMTMAVIIIIPMIMGRYHNVSRNPIPAMTWMVSPTTVVIWHPAPGFIGNPGPAIVITPCPAPFTIRSPVGNGNTYSRTPDSPILLHFDPVPIGIQIIMSNQTICYITTAGAGQDQTRAGTTPGIKGVFRRGRNHGVGIRIGVTHNQHITGEHLEVALFITENPQNTIKNLGSRGTTSFHIEANHRSICNRGSEV